MGSANSKIEEDKALQLCRERKKFVKQALDGRSSVAAAHVAYIQSLKATGIALRKFVEPDPLAFRQQFSVSSQSFSHRVDPIEVQTLSPTQSAPASSSQFHANYMKFSGSSSGVVQERLSSTVTGTVVLSNNTPQTSTTDADGVHQDPKFPNETAPWDYFGLFNPTNPSFSFEGKESTQVFKEAEEMKRLREEDGVPDLESSRGMSSVHETESEDEFDEEPSADSLVRRFDNVHRVDNQGMASSSKTLPSATSVTSETATVTEKEGNSPSRSSVRDTSSAADPSADKMKILNKNDHTEDKDKIAPKDFISSIKDIEALFIRASRSGEEVPRMLEANKLQLSPLFPVKESVSDVSEFIKACFSCGQDRQQVQEEPAQAAIKYLTWHGAAPSPSSSSQNPLSKNSKDETRVVNDSMFDSSCMVSGSHASTLDRLYAWEKKLRDEVRASQTIRKMYDSKCKVLGQLESKAESSDKIDKIRADVKDLHSRIRVAIHRIDSISKKIEELRDKELQPQLEELIDALSRMWKVMFDCHKLQYHVIAVALSSNTKISIQSEITLNLETELSVLSANFTKWIESQKLYLEAINSWLFKCVSLPKGRSRRKRRAPPPPLRNLGPAIYATCDVWLEKLSALPSKEVAESIKDLAAEVHQFLPRQEKRHVKSTKGPEEPEIEELRSSFEGFRSSLVEFLGKMSKYSECCFNMYSELKGTIEDAKKNYDRILRFTQSQA